MSLGNTAAQYGAVSKGFHWLTALLILTVIPLGIIANDMAHALRDPAITSTQDDILRTALLFSLHKTTGVLIFFVAIARILWAIAQEKPAPLHPDRHLETLLAEIVHWLLYGSLVLVPLSGWIHHSATVGFAPIWWPFGQSLPFVPKDPTIADISGTLHVVLERVLLVSIALHVAGALKHQFVDRDATLRRMLGGGDDLTAPASTHKSPLLSALAAVAIWAAALGAAATLGMFNHHHGAESAEHHAEDATVETAETSAPEPAASGWQVAEGTLALTVLQMGSEVSGEFKDWTAAIDFAEPQAPGPAGHVAVTVDISSLTLGSVTDQAMGPDYFDVKQFPTAQFDAEISKTETGYVATGPLTIRGVTLPATLPFELALEGNTATMNGTLSVARLDFDIGKSTVDEATLGFAVEVAVSLTANNLSGE